MQIIMIIWRWDGRREGDRGRGGSLPWRSGPGWRRRSERIRMPGSGGGGAPATSGRRWCGRGGVRAAGSRRGGGAASRWRGSGVRAGSRRRRGGRAALRRRGGGVGRGEGKGI